MSTKLTKKQKKGLAFREHKGRKRREVGQVPDVPEDDGAVPVSDIPVIHDAAQAAPKPLARKANVANVTKKRKRQPKEEDAKFESGSGGDVVNNDTEELSERKGKKRKLSQEIIEGTATAASNKPRFILFLGNLKYTTSLEAIKEHFSACDPPPQTRLLTPKPKSLGALTTKSKGCAFLEFSHRNALQQGLKLHGSTLEGRRINVELTAGGGGKGEQRVQKVKTKNKQLIEQRTTRAQKKIESGGEPEKTLTSTPQRHSTTSGIEEIQQKRRTWTIPENGEESGRGGVKKRGKKGKARTRDWGTGANAVAVG